MYKVDLNCDLGESFGNYKLGLDHEVIKYISSANVACGYHASDPLVMSETVRLAKENNVSIGAHPGFPDLMGFGRRNVAVSQAEAKAYILYQIGALDAFCRSCGTKLSHVKPHGALYNMAAADIELAKAICEGIYEYDKSLIILALSGSKMIDAAKEVGIKYASEVFADRAYEDDGSLVSRRKEGAVIRDEDLAVSRVVRMIKEKKVTTISGNDISISADSVCIHGDNEHALEFARKMRAAFDKEEIVVSSL